MPLVILEFDKDTEQEELAIVLQAQTMHANIHNVVEVFIRGKLKYEPDLTEREKEMLLEIRTQLMDGLT